MRNRKIQEVAQATACAFMTFIASGLASAGPDVREPAESGFMPSVQVLQPDGRLVVGGTSYRYGGAYSFAVKRLNSDGTPDTGFNGTGLVEIPIWGYYEFVGGLVLQPDGKIIVGGTASEPRTEAETASCHPAFCNYYGALVRLNADGALDRSFNGNGRLGISFGVPHRGEDCCGAVGELTLQPDGRILIGSSSWPVARVNVDGTLDRSLGGDAQEIDLAHFAPLNIGAGFTGSWFNPAQNGHGFALEVLPGPPPQLLMSWFTFAPEGGQSWIVGLGPISGSQAVLQGYQSVGAGRFPPYFYPDRVHQQYWGTLTFTFSDCNHGRVEWQSIWPGYGSGGMDLTRLTLPAGLTCSTGALGRGLQ